MATYRIDITVRTPTSQLFITLDNKCSLRECNDYDINNNILRLYIYNIIDYIFVYSFTTAPLPVVFNEPIYTLNQMDIATGLRISWTVSCLFRT